MKSGIQNILGLDLGTNSIGWALVEIDHDNCIVRIRSIGSRIIPMKPSEISKFENGGHMDSAAAARRQFRQPRRMNERFILRRDRLNCILDIYQMLPDHYRLEIDLETADGKRSGKLKAGQEPKIAYQKKSKQSESKHDKYDFIFEESYNEMLADLKSRYGNISQVGIPKDWTLYYLRQKALTKEVSLQELAWILHSFNHKRGYEKVDGTDETANENEARTVIVTKTEQQPGGKFKIEVSDNDDSNWTFSFIEDSDQQITHENDFKQLEIQNIYDKEGNLDSSKTKYIISEIRELHLTDKQTDKGKYILSFANGWTHESKARQLSTMQLGNTYTFICKTEYDKSGLQKKRSLTLSLESDKKANWAYIKLATENKIEKFNHDNNTKGVAAFIYSNLLSNDADKLNTKIIGGLVESVERKYYHEEVVTILKKQAEFHDELSNHDLYEQSVNTLYPHNEKHRRQLLQQSFPQLIADDILFYQRELKSKKSDIDNCPFETYTYTKDGKDIERAVKVAHRANPVFQEFRIWKFISQLHILEEPTEEHASPLDVTSQYLNFESKAALFDYMQAHKTIKQSVLQQSFLHLPKRGSGYVWNYEADHEEKGNETRYEFMWRLRRIKDFDWQTFLDAKHLDNGKEITNEYMLWHFFYAVKRRDQKNIGLTTLVTRLLQYAQIDKSFTPDIVKNLITFTGYKSEYAAYSEKALRKLLPLMRCGKYWCAEDVAKITGVVEDDECQGLMEHAACELVYADKILALRTQKWDTPHDIIHYLKHSFKSNTLKNPVVEKVVREMLYVVHDVWEEQLLKDESFNFSEIHVELGRELQKSPKQKQASVDEKKRNQLANHRAEMILKEMQLESLSPFMREKYRIYEECILSKIRFDKKETIYDFIDNEGSITKAEIDSLLKETEISRKDIKLYMMWLNKRFTSPYTGHPIALKELFDRTKYEREHVLPQERITLNALFNLFMCEKVVNKEKKARTGLQFIKEYAGRYIEGCPYPILTEEQYREWVNQNIHDPQRKEILLSEQVPARFTSNQLNSTRYISRLALSLLGRIVREQDEQGTISKNMLSVNGSVTATLRRDWKLGEMWNELVAPRFKRMNREIEKLTGIPTTLFGEEREIHGHNIFVPEVPEQYRDSFEKKRIDHRHHALDALVVALTERAHIQYISNVNGDRNTTDAFAARKALKYNHTYSENTDNGSKETHFLPPMQYKKDSEVVKYQYVDNDGVSSGFKEFALSAIQGILVSFKQNSRITSPRKNLYQHWDEQKGLIVTTSEADLKEERKWCMRQSLTPSATIYGLREVGGDKYLSTRWNHDLESLASLSKEKVLALLNSKSIPDEAVRKTLRNYFAHCDDIPAVAFSQDGVADMNTNIALYTPNRKPHAPIKKIAVWTKSEKGHTLTQNTGVKSRQFFKDTPNVLCVFYPDSSKVITLDMLSHGYKLDDGYSFVVAPNDLVYLPSQEQIEAAKKHVDSATFQMVGIKGISIDDVYKVSSFDPGANKANVNFAPSSLSQMIIEDSAGFTDNGRLLTSEGEKVKIKGEVVLTSERSNRCSKDIFGDRNIRDTCWKIVLSRTGHVKKLITQAGLQITE